MKHVIAFAVCSVCCVSVQADERITWNKEPIPLLLSVGQERTLFFPDNVQVGVPAKLNAEGGLRTQSTSGAVYWRAEKPFKNERIRVKLAESGLVMLFDVTAVAAEIDDLKPEPVRVLLPDGYITPTAVTQTDLGSATGGSPNEPAPNVEATLPEITPVELTRFAAHQLYAPARLLRDRAGIDRVPLNAPKVLPGLFFGGRLQALPQASWQGGGWYVTAVKLVNLSTEETVLDPRDLRGRFSYATFQHPSVGPRGSETDTTSVYLVTERPFGESLTLR